VTTAAQLGIKGGSNGGLLVAACMVQRPDLFGAVVCEVPLLDMSRYHLLHAGASWIDEYGDPDEPDEARVLAAYSPYHQVRAGVAYPPVLFTTATIASIPDTRARWWRACRRWGRSVSGIGRIPTAAMVAAPMNWSRPFMTRWSMSSCGTV
jgi:protease II